MRTTHTHLGAKETFATILSAVNKMVDTIRPTYGPASNKVIIDKVPYRMVVDDGVQIARDFELDDPMENAVVKLIRETAVKTNDRAGDGTTGALIILQAIINEVGRKSRFDGRKIELELKRGLAEVQEKIKASSRQIKTREDLEKLARVSFDDETISKMIADLYFKLGKDAIITIDKSPTMETILETTEGVSLPRGYLSPYMITNPERMEAVFEKPYILLTDYRITENSDIMPLMEKMVKAGVRNLVIIAENVEGNALATLVINEPQVMNPQTRQPGTFPSIAITLPTSNASKVMLEDYAMMTGGKVFTKEKGDKLEDCEIADLGRADKFICRRDQSIIVSPLGNKAAIMRAKTQLRAAAEKENNESRKKELKERLARFSNSLAVIKVGALTDNEQKALKYKVEDCVNAVKSAYQHGVVCGAGLALSRVNTSSPILNEALKYPARQLRENMGMDEGINLKADEALNVVTGKAGKFMEVGVMDPVDVLLAGVESAVSIASILLTSSGMIVEAQVPEDK